MLQAVVRKKTRTALHEDEITACVFGPLVYAEARDVWAVVQAIISGRASSSMVREGVPTSVLVRLWPNLGHRRSRRVEPDVTMRFDQAGQHFVSLVVEAKWSSPQSIDEAGLPMQLARQWACIPESERDRTIHLYLVLDTEQARREMAALRRGAPLPFARNLWERSLIILSWKELADVLDQESVTWRRGLRAWSRDVVAFLEQLKVHRFAGFSSVPFGPVMAIPIPVYTSSRCWFEFFDDVQSNPEAPTFFWSSGRRRNR